MTGPRQAALLAAVCLILHHLGPLPAVVEAPAITVALLARAVQARHPVTGGGWIDHLLRWGPWLIGIPLVLILPAPEARLGALMALLAASPDHEAPREILFVGLALAALLAAHTVPLIWMSSVELSRLASGLAGTISGQHLDFGPSVSGLYLIGLAFMMRICAGAGRSRAVLRSPRCLAAGAAWCGFMVLLPRLGRQGGPLQLEGLFNLTHEHLSPQPQQFVPAMLGWLPILLVVESLLLCRAPAAPHAHRAGSMWLLPGLVAAGALCFATGLWLAADPIPPARGTGDIVLLRGPGADARLPEHGRWGLASAGMFGLLPRAMAAEGFAVRSEEGPLTATMLAGAAALVMALPAAGLDAAQVDHAHSFVRRGGTLLVLTDHTDLMGIMEPSRRLLAPAGIGVAYDSAFAAVPFWHDCLSGPLAWRWGPTGVGTGASLEIHGRARPLLIGKYGLSDAGDRANAGAGAGLGNYAYDDGERAGDVVLAAWARVGRGRIIALGDTSSFQNLPLPFAHQFVAGLCAALARPVPLDRRPPLPVAIVDMSHLNDATLDFWHKDALGGLLATLQRDGRVPIVAESARELRHLLHRFPRALCVLAAPRRPLEPELVAQLTQRLRDGADTLVAAGPGSARALGPLLQERGLSIQDLPLGPAPVVSDTDPAQLAAARRRPQFRRAWPVVSDRNRPVRIWSEAFGRPVVVDFPPERAGAGRLMLIADPSFLTDDVLESEHAAWEGNVDLVSRLLADRWSPP